MVSELKPCKCGNFLLYDQPRICCARCGGWLPVATDTEARPVTPQGTSNQCATQIVDLPAGEGVVECRYYTEGLHCDLKFKINCGASPCRLTITTPQEDADGVN